MENTRDLLSFSDVCVFVLQSAQVCLMGMQHKHSCVLKSFEQLHTYLAYIQLSFRASRKLN